MGIKLVASISVLHSITSEAIQTNGCGGPLNVHHEEADIIGKWKEKEEFLLNRLN